MEKLEKLLTGWQDAVLAYLPQLVLSVIIVVIFHFLGKLFKKLSFRFYSRILKKQSDVVRIISSFVYFIFLCLGILIALDVLGFDDILTKLLAGAGIMGIVAGFAFKDIVSNIFAGLLLHMQLPFKSGDWVEIENTFGTVKTIGWITTSIATISGEEVFIPNQLIYNNSFTNYSVFGKRRVVFKSGVSYGDDLDFVKKTALEEVNKIDAVLKNEVIDCYFTEIGSSAYNFEVRFWIRFKHQADYLKAMDEIIVRIQKRFAKENISLAYSVMTLDFGVKGGVNLYDNPVTIRQSKAE